MEKDKEDVIKEIVIFTNSLPEWDVSKISPEVCKDILYRALRKILKGYI